MSLNLDLLSSRQNWVGNERSRNGKLQRGSGTKSCVRLDGTLCSQTDCIVRCYLIPQEGGGLKFREFRHPFETLTYEQSILLKP